MATQQETIESGTYTLLTDRWAKPEYVLDSDGRVAFPERVRRYTNYTRGDDVEIDLEYETEEYVRALLDSGSIAPHDSAKAKEARGELEQGIVPPNVTAEELRARADAMIAEAERQEELRGKAQQEDGAAVGDEAVADHAKEEQKDASASGSGNGRRKRNSTTSQG